MTEMTELSKLGLLSPKDMEALNDVFKLNTTVWQTDPDRRAQLMLALKTALKYNSSYAAPNSADANVMEVCVK